MAGILRHATHLPGWRVPELRERLTELLGTEVEIENEVNLVALAEHDTGAAAEVDTFVLLWSALGAAVLAACAPTSGNGTPASGDVR